MKITKNKPNPQTKEIYTTVSLDMGTKHVILRLERGLEAIEDPRGDGKDDTGISGYVIVRRKRKQDKPKKTKFGLMTQKEYEKLGDVLETNHEIDISE